MTQKKLLKTQEREELFLALASRPEGATVPDVHAAATEQGDQVTQEAYHNLARRLVHRGILVADGTARPLTYRTGQDVDGVWLEEDDLAGWVDEDYPLLILPILRESARQVRFVPEEVWLELRER